MFQPIGSFHVDEICFLPTGVLRLMQYLREYEGELPAVRLHLGGAQTASLSGEVAHAVFRLLQCGDDPVNAFLHRAAIEPQLDSYVCGVEPALYRSVDVQERIHEKRAAIAAFCRAAQVGSWQV